MSSVHDCLLQTTKVCILSVFSQYFLSHLVFDLSCQKAITQQIPIEPFDLQFGLHLFLQAATVIGRNKPRDLF